MQPGGERRFTAKRGDLAIKLQEGLLRQVFRFRRVADHTQAKRIHPALVQTIQGCEAFGIALLGAVNRFLLGDAVSQNLLSGRQNWSTRSAAGFDATTVAVRCLRRSEEHTSELQSLRHLV